MRSFVIGFFLLLYFFTTQSYAQNNGLSYADKYPLAKLSEKEMYEFDVARPIQHFEALPDGSDWFAVDDFGHLQTMIIRGVSFDRRFNEIPRTTARFSPKGDYVIWMGLERSFDNKGFNTTTTTVYKSTLKSVTPDSLGTYESDYNQLYFSRTGKHWAATMPASNALQRGLRDVVLVDGLILAKGNPLPGMFSFDKTEDGWAYRSTEGRDENLVTPFALQKMYTRSKTNPYLASSDPVIYHFSPDIKSFPYILDSRDYDFDYRNPAQLFKTSYFLEGKDTIHSYIIFDGKRQPNFHWINNIQIDTNGPHIVYFAGDTTGDTRMAQRNEKTGVVVKDGKVIAGPYDDMGRLFLSPSGKNIAWSAMKNGVTSLYLNGKKIGDVGEYVDCYWSPDEKKFAYLSSDERGRNFIVAGGKRSPSFERIGRVGWSSDNKSVEYCAVKYNKLLQIKQPF